MGDRLYTAALERQARAERRTVERQQQLEDAELAEVTFQPAITPRARTLSTMSAVEERTKQWWDLSKERLADHTAASPFTPKPSKGGAYDVIETR